MRILVTGADGMLGSSLCPVLKSAGHKVYPSDINVSENQMLLLNVCNFDEVKTLVKKIRPEIILHLAAETDVDKCQTQKEHAYKVNTLGTENIALVCQSLDMSMVYISTASVFDGQKEEPYTEFDQPDPINTYARTKWEGEKVVQSLLRKYYIVRAGWMIGGYEKDKKFVAKIIKLLETKNEISVVTDKFGTPTFTDDLSRGIARLISTGRYGLYHIGNTGGCSRYDLAKKIAEFMGKQNVHIKPVTSGDFPLLAPRPRSEMICNYKLQILQMDFMPFWESTLKNYVVTLCQRR